MCVYRAYRAFGVQAFQGSEWEGCFGTNPRPLELVFLLCIHATPRTRYSAPGAQLVRVVPTSYFLFLFCFVCTVCCTPHTHPCVYFFSFSSSPSWLLSRIVYFILNVPLALFFFSLSSTRVYFRTLTYDETPSDKSVQGKGENSLRLRRCHHQGILHCCNEITYSVLVDSDTVPDSLSYPQARVRAGWALSPEATLPAMTDTLSTTLRMSSPILDAPPNTRTSGTRKDI